MQKITRQAVESLLTAEQPQPAVTMYVPMHTTASPPHISENQIRLKNAISDVKDRLAVYESGHKLAVALDEWLDGIYDDLRFWEHLSPGILICARPDSLQMFHLPVDTEEYIAVDEQFHLAPVLAMLNEFREYYVLTVDQHNPKLFRGDMYGLEPSGIQLPESLHAALNIDEPNQKSENQGSASGSSLNTGSFNGRGGARNPQEEDRMKFFRIIDRIICTADTQGLPIILAGVDAETVEFRSVSKYPRILEDTVSGSHADSNLQELFAQVRAIVESELVLPVRQAAVAEYQRLEGANPDRVAHDMKSIQDATEQGRVDKLLATMGRRTTDTIRDTLQAVSKITFPDAEHSKRLNTLATKVWQMSGTVISLTPSEMPHGAPMVARLRY